MAQFRNITDQVLYVVTDRGMEKCEPDSVLTVSDAFAESHYFQTGETGEPAIFEAVAASSSKKSKSAPIEPAVEPSN